MLCSCVGHSGSGYPLILFIWERKYVSVLGPAAFHYWKGVWSFLSSVTAKKHLYYYYYFLYNWLALLRNSVSYLQVWYFKLLDLYHGLKPPAKSVCPEVVLGFFHFGFHYSFRIFSFLISASGTMVMALVLIWLKLYIPFASFFKYRSKQYVYGFCVSVTETHQSIYLKGWLNLLVNFYIRVIIISYI